MVFLFGLILILKCGLIASQSCTLPSYLTGSWLSSDMETITISQTTPSLSMNVTFVGSGQTFMEFDCLLVDGWKYVLQSKTQVTAFSGTLAIYMYMCIQFTQASGITYMYQLYSDVEPAFGNRRILGLQNDTVVTSASQVCTATLDTASFGVMVQIGSESQLNTSYACPGPLLGTYNFTSPSLSCTDPQMNTCGDEQTTSVRVNTSGCTSKVFFSDVGYLACVASAYDAATATYYTFLYNTDDTVNSATQTYRFTCLALSSNTTTYISYKYTGCDANQSPSVAPTDGHRLELSASLTCIPTSDETDYTLLIVLLVLLFVLILAAIIIGCIYWRHRKKQKEKAREKQMLTTEEHPLGETSLALDAPASMERVSENGYIEIGHETSRSPRKRKKDRRNPMSDESCMALDLRARHWSRSLQHDVGLSDIDPFSEMDGSVVPISPKGNRTINDLKNSRKSFGKSRTPRAITNGNANKPLAITAGPGLTLEDLEMYKSMNGGAKVPPISHKAPSVMTSRSKTARSRGAPSLISARSKTNVSMSATKVTSPKARSTKAPSMANGSVRGGPTRSVKAMSIANGAVPRASNKPKLTRSATSTRIGSITKRLTSPRKKVSRSQTVVLEPKMGDALETENVSTMVAAETGDTAPTEPGTGNTYPAPPPSEAGKSTKSKMSVPMTSSGKTPRRSILKKRSVYMSSHEYMTEDEIFADVIQGEQPSAMEDYLPHTLRESYLSIKQKFDIRANENKPHATKSPWR